MCKRRKVWEWQQNSGWSKRGKQRAASSGQIVFGKEVEVCGWQAKVISLFSFWASLYIWWFFFIALHFCGHFWFLFDSRQFKVCWKFCWNMFCQKWNCHYSAKHILNSKMKGCLLLHSRWHRKFCLCFPKNWENQRFMFWHEGGTFSIPKSFCHTVQSTPLSLWPGGEDHKEAFMALYECNREFEKQKLHQFWTCLCQLQQCPYEVCQLSSLFRLSFGVIFEWHCTGLRCCATEDNILR